MKNLTSLVPLILLMVGCGSSTGTRDGGAGEPTFPIVPTSGNGGGAGSAVSETGGTGGTVPTSGAGGEPGSGGNPAGAAGEPIEPAGGSSGSVVCVPKTCLTRGVELDTYYTAGDPVPQACGLLDDGCGNYIDCGGCEPHYTCGGGTAEVDPLYPAMLPRLLTADDAVPGICKGGCTEYGDYGRGDCYVDYNLTACVGEPVNVPPREGCVGSVDSNYWCCPS